MMTYIQDTNTNETFKLDITEEQKKLLDWLYNYNIIPSDFYIISTSEEEIGIHTITL